MTDRAILFAPGGRLDLPSARWSRAAMLARGGALLKLFCAENALPEPAVSVERPDAWAFGAVCAYYRDNTVHIVSELCAGIGHAGRAWSFPGYTVDRTPYGVQQHELGHHVDVLRSTRKGPYFGDFSTALRGHSGEEQISSYCPNTAEWFAEMFRLFVTNPDLLRQLRPRTYRELTAAGFRPLFGRSWAGMLAGAPPRTLTAARRKVEVVGAASRQGAML
jgi:hypothetical protein